MYFDVGLIDEMMKRQTFEIKKKNDLLHFAVDKSELFALGSVVLLA